jgi:hypothetical protein
MKAVRTDYTGYEGKYVAVDARTRQVVLAYEDPRVLLREAEQLRGVIVHGRVPLPGELRHRIG